MMMTTSRNIDSHTKTRLFWEIARLVRSDFGQIPQRLEETISLLDALGEDSPLLSHQCSELISTIHENINELYEEDYLYDIFAFCPDL